MRQLPSRPVIQQPITMRLYLHSDHKDPRSLACRVKAAAVVLFIIAWLPLSGQMSPGKNHLKLQWHFFETDHFRIIYHSGLDTVASRSAGIAETQVRHIISILGFQITDKIPIILSDDDDFSNGLAHPLNHAIFIWIPAEVKATTGSAVWLEAVIGHELGHMVTFYSARNWMGKPWELLTLGLTPTWFLEGTAQYVSEEWDDHRNLLLRNAVRDRALLPLRKLDGFVGADVYDARLLYEEGHGLTRYIASRYGENQLHRLLVNHRKNPVSFSGTLKKTLGVSQRDLYNAWLEETQASADQVISFHESAAAAGTDLRIPLEVVTGIRQSCQGQLAATGMERWDEGVTRLYLQTGDTWKQIGGDVTGGYFSWAPDGHALVYNRLIYGSNGSIFQDLFIYNLRQNREARLTRNLRATDPAWSPQGDQVCFVRRESGYSNLMLLDLNKDTLKTVTHFGAGHEVFSPSWSPDGDFLVFSWMDPAGSRDIGMIRSDGSDLMKLVSDSSDSRSPVWSGDGQWIVYCCYENGTPNLVRIHPDGSGRIVMTDLAGGAFNPSWSTNQQQILLPVFESRNHVRGFAVPSGRQCAPGAEMDRPLWALTQPQAPDDPVSVTAGKTRPYASMRSIRPCLVLPYPNVYEKDVNFGLAVYATDPLFLHQVTAYGAAGPHPQYRFNYQNTVIGPVIEVIAQGADQPFRYQVNNEKVTVHERNRRLGLTLQIPLRIGPSLLHQHWLLGSADFQSLRCRVPNEALETMLQPVLFNGRIHTLGLGYVWSRERPDTGQDVHPVTGFSCAVFVNRADKAWGSDRNMLRINGTVICRRELPWLRHVAAVRMGGLISRGSQIYHHYLALSSPEPVRALSGMLQGSRFFFGNLEYRFPVSRDLGFRIPVFYFERLTGAFWFDMARVSGSPSLFETTAPLQIRTMTGAEVRNRIYLFGKLPIVIRGGYGWNLTDGHGLFYAVLGNVF